MPIQHSLKMTLKDEGTLSFTKLEDPAKDQKKSISTDLNIN